MTPRSRSTAVPVPRPVLQAAGKAVLYLAAGAAGWAGNHWLGTFERLTRVEAEIAGVRASLDKLNVDSDRRTRELKRSIDKQSERVDQLLFPPRRR
jgi:hypothetical protein